jgi:hypothetical protein
MYESAHPLLDRPADQPAEPVIVFPPFGSDPAEAALFELGRALQDMGYRFTAVSPETRAAVNARPGHGEAQDLRGVFGWCRPFLPEVLPARLLRALEEAESLERRPFGRLQSRIAFASNGGQLMGHPHLPPGDRAAVAFGPQTYRFIHLLRRALGGGGRLLEVGCGCGAAGLSLADRFTSLTLCDANPLAVRCARVNAALAGCDQVEVSCSDGVDGIRGSYQAIIADPPAPMDSAGPWLGEVGQLGIESTLRLVGAALPLLAPGGCLVLTASAPVVDGVDLLEQALAPLLISSGLAAHYDEIEVDVGGALMANPRYDRVERIARIAVVVGQPGTAEPAHPSSARWEFGSQLGGDAGTPTRTR